MAEAPSFRISMRSMIATGMVDRSTVWLMSVAQREPSTRIRVRCAPRLRREICCEPSLPLVCVVTVLRPEPSTELSFDNTSATLFKPVPSICARVTTWTAEEPSSSTERRMLEPKTLMVSISLVSSLAASWANAEAVAKVAVAPTNNANLIALDS